MRVINCTPHEITLPNGGKIDASETPARVSETRTPSYDYLVCHEGAMRMALLRDGAFDYSKAFVEPGVVEKRCVPIVSKSWGETINLPDPRPDTLYVVSAIVANANPKRPDLLCPETQRTDAGVVCTGLVRNVSNESYCDAYSEGKMNGMRDAYKSAADALFMAGYALPVEERQTYWNNIQQHIDLIKKTARLNCAMWEEGK